MLLTFLRVPGGAAVGRGYTRQAVGPAEGAGAGGQGSAGVGRGGAGAACRECRGGGGRGAVALGEESDGGTVSHTLRAGKRERQLTAGSSYLQVLGSVVVLLGLRLLLLLLLLLLVLLLPLLLLLLPGLQGPSPADCLFRLLQVGQGHTLSGG